MVALKTKILAVALVVGIAATGVTLAAGVTDTSGNGLVTVEQEPLQINTPQDSAKTPGQPNGGPAGGTSDLFVTAEGATVFEGEVTGVDGGNDFTVDIPTANTADHSLYLTIDMDTSEDIYLFDVNVSGFNGPTNGNSAVELEGEDGVYLAEIGPNVDASGGTGPAPTGGNGQIELRFGVANDADANVLHTFSGDIQFEEVSPSQVDEMADRGN
jgi:hypothetical protein